MSRTSEADQTYFVSWMQMLGHIRELPKQIGRGFCGHIWGGGRTSVSSLWCEVDWTQCNYEITFMVTSNFLEVIITSKITELSLSITITSTSESDIPWDILEKLQSCVSAPWTGNLPEIEGWTPISCWVNIDWFWQIPPESRLVTGDLQRRGGALWPISRYIVM